MRQQYNEAQNLSDSQLTRRHLNKDAVPSIFPNLPSYLSSAVTPRTTATAVSAAGCRQQEGRRLEMLEQSFTADDDIESLTTQQLKERLEGESALPGGFYLALIDGMLLIYRLMLINSAEPCIH